MATMDFTVQNIDEISPDFGVPGGVHISCDMNYRSMEQVVVQIRENIDDETWEKIVKDTDE